MQIYLYILLVTMVVAGGCRNKVEVGAFDPVAWQADPFACKGERQSMVPGLQELRPLLLGHNPREVMRLLGRPEAEELRAGSERVFIYFLEPGPRCEQRDQLSAANKMQVRFNALNQVSEVSYTEPIGDLLRP